jgi:hypothetical protein
MLAFGKLHLSGTFHTEVALTHLFYCLSSDDAGVS